MAGEPGRRTFTLRDDGAAYLHVPCTVFAAAALQAADPRRPNVLLWVSDNQPRTA